MNKVKMLGIFLCMLVQKPRIHEKNVNKSKPKLVIPFFCLETPATAVKLGFHLIKPIHTAHLEVELLCCCRSWNWNFLSRISASLLLSCILHLTDANSCHNKATLRRVFPSADANAIFLACCERTFWGLRRQLAHLCGVPVLQKGAHISNLQALQPFHNSNRPEPSITVEHLSFGQVVDERLNMFPNGLRLAASVYDEVVAVVNVAVG